MKRRRNSNLLPSIVWLGLIIVTGVLALAVLRLSKPGAIQSLVSEPRVAAAQTPERRVLPVGQSAILQAPEKAPKLLESGLPVPDTPRAPRADSMTLVTRTNSNARTEPSISAAMVAVIPKGATVKMIARKGEWRQVGYFDIRGWVRQDNFLSPQ